MDLFIFGNGFDISHGIKSKYSDFHRFIYDKIPCEEREKEFDDIDEMLEKYSLEVTKMDQHGGLIVEHIRAYILTYHMLNIAQARSNYINKGSIENWSDLEYLLYYIPSGNEVAQGILANFRWEEYLDNDDVNPWNMGANIESTADQIFENLYHAFRLSFIEWVSQIDLGNGRKMKFNSIFTRAINKKSKFITFNYTKTLEELYLVPSGQILHIHGNAYSPVFGHTSEDRDGREFDPFNLSITLSERVEEGFRKNVNSIIDNQFKKKNFIDFNCVKNIYIWGWSVDSSNFVDKKYLKYIIEHCRNLENIYVEEWQYNHGLPLIRKNILESGWEGAVLKF